MPIRTPRVTLITRREGQRVALPAGAPVELTKAEIAHLERDSPGALMPVRPEDAAAEPAHNPLVVPAEVADNENPDDGKDGEGDAETEEERLAREAVERAKAGKPAGKAPGKGKASKPASGDADGL